MEPYSDSLSSSFSHNDVHNSLDHFHSSHFRSDLELCVSAIESWSRLHDRSMRKELCAEVSTPLVAVGLICRHEQLVHGGRFSLLDDVCSSVLIRRATCSPPRRSRGPEWLSRGCCWTLASFHGRCSHAGHRRWCWFTWTEIPVVSVIALEDLRRKLSFRIFCSKGIYALYVVPVVSSFWVFLPPSI